MYQIIVFFKSRPQYPAIFNYAGRADAMAAQNKFRIDMDPVFEIFDDYGNSGTYDSTDLSGLTLIDVAQSMRLDQDLRRAREIAMLSLGDVPQAQALQQR